LAQQSDNSRSHQRIVDRAPAELASKFEQRIEPINIEEQEVLCQNCYEMIAMTSVDTHSLTCFRNETSLRPSQAGDYTRTDFSIDEEREHLKKTQELDDRIFKLI